MTDNSNYASLTVKELKEELKKRSIPSTGLTRKQQIIDRLIQHDGETTKTDDKEEEVTAGEADAAILTVEEVAQENEIEDVNTAEVANDQDEVELEAQSKAPRVATEAALIEAHASTHATSMSPTGAEESRKRKRRSLTPAVEEDEIQKKLKHDDEPPKEETAEVVANAPIQIGEPDTTINLGAGISETETVGLAGTTAEPVATAEGPPDQLGPEETARNAPQPPSTEMVQQAAGMEELATEPKEDNKAEGILLNEQKNENEPEAKVTAAHTQSSLDENTLSSDMATKDSPTKLASMHAPVSTIEPGRHPATRALYITGLKRPLHASDLEAHLTSLASEPDVLEDLHLNNFRTHAFAFFKTLAAATKVRSALNGRAWPEERDRPPLYVDFIPEDKVRKFIEQETAAARGTKWEVVYTNGENGEVEVSLQQTGGTSVPSNAAGLGPPPTKPGPGLDMKIPTGPRSMTQKRQEPRKEGPAAAQKKPESTQFLALDTLFKSTVTKPKLYFQPVANDLASSRLRQIQAGREVKAQPNTEQEKCRYTWEDGQLVNGGPEYGLRRDRGRRAGFRKPGQGARDLYRPSDGYRPRRD